IGKSIFSQRHILYAVAGEQLVPAVFLFEDVLDGFAGGTVAAGAGGDVFGDGPHLIHRVGGGDGVAAAQQGGQVDQVIAHVGGRLQRHVQFLAQLHEGSPLVLGALLEVADAQIRGTHGNDAGDAAGDDAHVKPQRH